jgi:hypothetical protein
MVGVKVEKKEDQHFITNTNNINNEVFNKITLCLIPAFSIAQIDPTWGYVTAQKADSLKGAVQSEKNDTLNMAAFRSLGFYYQDFIPDSGLYFHEKQLALSKKLKMNLWQADACSQLGYV